MGACILLRSGFVYVEGDGTRRCPLRLCAWNRLKLSPEGMLRAGSQPRLSCDGGA